MISDFREFYLNYYKQAYRVCHLILGSHELAEKAVNEAFREFFIKKVGSNSTENLATLLALLTAKRAVFLSEQHAAPSLRGNQSGRGIMEAIQQLDPQIRRIIILKYYLALENEEISRYLLIPLDMVRTAVYKGKEEISKNLFEDSQ